MSIQISQLLASSNTKDEIHETWNESQHPLSPFSL